MSNIDIHYFYLKHWKKKFKNGPTENSHFFAVHLFSVFSANSNFLQEKMVVKTIHLISVAGIRTHGHESPASIHYRRAPEKIINKSFLVTFVVVELNWDSCSASKLTVVVVVECELKLALKIINLFYLKLYSFFAGILKKQGDRKKWFKLDFTDRNRIRTFGLTTLTQFG